MMMATDGAPQQAGVEAEAQALTHDTLVALVDNRDYQRLALLYVAAKLDLADALRGAEAEPRPGWSMRGAPRRVAHRAAGAGEPGHPVARSRR